jgi:hypothetical protein
MNVAKVVVAITMLLPASIALAHDLITAELAERYLQQASNWHEQIRSGAQGREPARACLQIGEMLDEIRALLNRDLAVHGRVQGLASAYLVSGLERTGTPLAFSPSRNYFTANSDYYRSALELGLGDDLARRARVGLLRGEFYDNFSANLLDTSVASQPLQEQLALADALISDALPEPDMEEVRFIATILYARAAMSASRSAKRVAYRDKALILATAFERDYPDSLRATAIPIVRSSLGATP